MEQFLFLKKNICDSETLCGCGTLLLFSFDACTHFMMDSISTVRKNVTFLLLFTKFMTQFKIFLRLFHSHLLLMWEKCVHILVYRCFFFVFNDITWTHVPHMLLMLKNIMKLFRKKFETLSVFILRINLINWEYCVLVYLTSFMNIEMSYLVWMDFFGASIRTSVWFFRSVISVFFTFL